MFSDTIVVILLVAVILVSFIGSLLVYNNLSNAEVDVPEVNIIEQHISTIDGANGLVVVNVVDKSIDEGDIT